MRCKSLPEEWTAAGRLSDVSVQEGTNRLRKKRRKECVCVFKSVSEVCRHTCACVLRNGEDVQKRKAELLQDGAQALIAAVEKCF